MAKEGLLRTFAKGHKTKSCEGYRYISSKKVSLDFLLGSEWKPIPENISKLNAFISKNGQFMGSYACFYSTSDSLWYVIDHLWVAMIAATGPEDMKNYMRKVLATMVKNAWKEEPAVIKEAPKVEKKKTPELPFKGIRLISMLEKIEIEVVESFFTNTYGVSRAVFDSIITSDNDFICINYTKSIHILDYSKALYSNFNVLMKDFYVLLKQSGIVTQSTDRQVGKYHIFVTDKCRIEGWAYDHHTTETDYPIFTPKGIFNISLLLKDKGMIDKMLLIMPKY